MQLFCVIIVLSAVLVKRGFSQDTNMNVTDHKEQFQLFMEPARTAFDRYNQLQRYISHLENTCQDGHIPQEHCSEMIGWLREQMQQNNNSLQFSSNRRTNLQRANNNNSNNTNNISSVLYENNGRSSMGSYVEIKDNGNGRIIRISLQALVKSGPNGKDNLPIYNDRGRQSSNYLNQNNRSTYYKNETQEHYNIPVYRYPTNTRSNGKPINVTKDEPHTPLYVYSNNRTLNTNTTRNNRQFTPIHNVPSNNNINHSNIDTTRQPKNLQDSRSKFYRNINLTKNDSYIIKDKGNNGTTTSTEVPESVITSTEQSKSNKVNTDFINVTFGEADEYGNSTTEESITSNSDYTSVIIGIVSGVVLFCALVVAGIVFCKTEGKKPIRNLSPLDDYKARFDTYTDTRPDTYADTSPDTYTGTRPNTYADTRPDTSYTDTRPDTNNIYENIPDRGNIDNPDYVYDNAYEYRTFHNPKLDMPIYETITCQGT